MILFEDYLHTPKLLLNGGRLGELEASASKHETSRHENESDIVHLTPKYFFRENESLHLFETHCGHFFIFLTNPVIL